MIENNGSSGPLAGIRVLEVGSTIAGPFCGRLLADFGADVIKIEPPDGDPVRSMGKRFQQRSLYAASIFRNKAMVSINLRTETGRHLLAELAAVSDVLVENFRPGRMESWGLSYDNLASLNPRLVMARISGFGQDGPYRDRPGYGVIGEAMSGLRHLTGEADRPPSRVAVSLTDYVTGLYAAFGVVLAVIARESTGRGQYIDSALYEAAFSFMEPWIPAYQKLGHVAVRSGSRLPESTPNNLYSTADGEYIHIAAPGDGPFRRLAHAMDRSDLIEDERFVTATERSVHYEMLDDLISRWTSGHNLADLEELLLSAEVPASRIFTVADIFNDVHFSSRGSIVEAPDEELGPVAMSAVVPRLSATPGGVRWAGREIGSDTRTVLVDLLGVSQDQLNDWVRTGVIADGTGKRQEPLL